MDPSKIELENLSKLFEYERLAREVDECNDINYIKNIAKSYIKLYFKQQEAIINLGLTP